MLPREVFERELSRKSVLKVVLPSPSMARADAPSEYELFVLNDGNKSERGFWFLGVPKRLRGRLTVEPRNGNEEVLVAGDNRDIVGDFDQPLVGCFTDDYYLLKFRCTVPVGPGVLMPCASVIVQWQTEESEWPGQKSVEIRDQAWRILGWFTNGPSGRFPARGMRKLRLYSYSESWFKAHYGGRELPEHDEGEFP